MNAREFFPGGAALREMAVEAGGSPSTGNSWAAIFRQPLQREHLRQRASEHPRQRNVGIVNLYRIAQALGMSLSELFAGVEGKKERQEGG